MDWTKIVEQTISIANALIAAGMSAKPAFDALKKFFSGEEVTPDAISALQAENDRLHALIQAPLPDDPTGETNV